MLPVPARAPAGPTEVWLDVQRPQDIFIDSANRVYVGELVWRAGMNSFRRGAIAAEEPARLSVYDIDDNHKLLRKIAVPNSGDYKGIGASASLGLLYLTSHRGDELIEDFYARLFDAAPAVRSLFPNDMTKQRAMLLSALVLLIYLSPWLPSHGRANNFLIDPTWWEHVKDVLVHMALPSLTVARHLPPHAPSTWMPYVYSWPLAVLSSTVYCQNTNANGRIRPAVASSIEASLLPRPYSMSYGCTP